MAVNELGVSRGTVVEAYAQLVAEGWPAARQGAATVVASVPALADPPDLGADPLPPARSAAARYDLRTGRPDLSKFPRGAWGKRWQQRSVGPATPSWTTATPVPIAVDDRGLVVDDLAATDAEAVITTPAHQFRTGVVLAPERRASLVCTPDGRHHRRGRLRRPSAGMTESRWAPCRMLDDESAQLRSPVEC